MNYQYDLIAIGSGSAGRRIAVALKRVGWKTAIVEKDVETHLIIQDTVLYPILRLRSNVLNTICEEYMAEMGGVRIRIL